MWTSINKKIFVFLIVIFIVGFGAGIFFLISNGNSPYLKNLVEENVGNFNINNTFNHLFILSLFLVLSILVIGVPLYIVYYFYSGFISGFVVALFTSFAGLKGLLFGLIYLILTQLIFVSVLAFLIMLLIRISINTIRKILKKYKGSLIELNRGLYKKALISLGVLFVNDLVIWLIFGKLLNVFKFLLI